MKESELVDMAVDVGDFVLENTAEGTAGYDLIRAGCVVYFMVVFVLIGLGWVAVASYSAPLIPSIIVGVLVAAGAFFIFVGRD